MDKSRTPGHRVDYILYTFYAKHTVVLHAYSNELNTAYTTHAIRIFSNCHYYYYWTDLGNVQTLYRLRSETITIAINVLNN
jgi:hypothetical protein